MAPACRAPRRLAATRTSWNVITHPRSGTLTTRAHLLHADSTHPVDVRVVPASAPRDRLTVGFRLILAIPHLILVGGPIAFAAGWGMQSEPGGSHEWSASGGVIGAVAAVAACMAWFAILFTGKCPDGLRNLLTFYLRWRVRSVASLSLLRDEYPPFGDAPYPASLAIKRSGAPRDTWLVALRLLLVLPHVVMLCVLGVAWLVTTTAAWFAMLFTGQMPAALEHFAVGVLRRWTSATP